MEDDSKTRGFVKWGLGILGLGAIGAAVTIPKIGVWVGLAVLILALLLFGGYFLWRRLRERRQSRKFEGAIETQTAAAPRSISDPNKRAALDKLRQKFQTGLQEFKSRGKDIYKLPWYAIIGESGSGKTEAIRHSGIDFPPGLNEEQKGSGGTVNMDWWFTNHGVILDTAGSMVLPEVTTIQTPEWGEFLRLLKKSRPHCPINGLFLVLSIESLIKDSADEIARKASRLAQQLDLIQRTLDVRFPVYLLVTKCDLLTGFREFFDNVDDPLLQHQMFGWSNPEPLDAHFRPDLVEQHLKTVAERVRRRRLALLREGTTAPRFGDTQFFAAPSLTGGSAGRRLDEVDALFALPESIMRLAPRLRRYLETIFVAGEWSAKPVFLRGIYFTSSMREGRALDEAIALATGVPLDQLPEDRRWEKNRAFFLRDLFLEKVFRECGLVTSAANTLKLLRHRQLLIFGTAMVLLLLLLTFALFSSRSLDKSVRAEAAYWQAGTNGWNQGEWSPAIVRGVGGDMFHYAGTNAMESLGNITVVQYHKRLCEMVQNPLRVGLIFKPIAWISSGKDLNRREAQRALFEGGVLRPLILGTRSKMQKQQKAPTADDEIRRLKGALLSLMQLEADHLANGGSMQGASATNSAEKYLKSFLPYLLDTDYSVDTNLVDVFAWTYSQKNRWPPDSLSGGNSLSNNLAIKNGLDLFQKANVTTQKNIADELKLLNALTDSLTNYHQKEIKWLKIQEGSDPCHSLEDDLLPAKKAANGDFSKFQSVARVTDDPLTNLEARYTSLEKSATDASRRVFDSIRTNLPDLSLRTGLFAEIDAVLNSFAREAAGAVRSSYLERSNSMAILDREQMVLINSKTKAHDARWDLFRGACELAGEPIIVNDDVIGDKWTRFDNLNSKVSQFRSNLNAYSGPLANDVAAVCQRIAGDAEQRLKVQFVEEYAKLAERKVKEVASFDSWSPRNFKETSNLLYRIELDLKTAAGKLNEQDLNKLNRIGQRLLDNAKEIRGKLHFPVLLNEDPNEAMNFADLIALKNMSGFLTVALQNPVWASRLEETQVRPILGILKGCNEVVAALLDEDKPAQIEFFFVPPKEGTPGDDIIRVYRQANISLGSAESGWTELTAHFGKEKPVSLVKGAIDRGIRVSFRKLPNDPPILSLNEVNWGLLRLIRADAGVKVDRLDDGLKWRVTLRLDDKQGVSGDAVFEIVLVLNRPLPELEGWPKR